MQRLQLGIEPLDNRDMSVGLFVEALDLRLQLSNRNFVPHRLHELQLLPKLIALIGYPGKFGRACLTFLSMAHLLEELVQPGDLLEMQAVLLRELLVDPPQFQVVLFLRARVAGTGLAAENIDLLVQPRELVYVVASFLVVLVDGFL